MKIMETWENYNISKLMIVVNRNGLSPDLKHLCDDAEHEFHEIKEKIHINYGRKIDPVSKLIDDVAHMRVCKPEDVKEALSLFNEYIKPFLKEEERKKSSVDKRSNSIKDPAYRDNDIRPGSIENEAQKGDNIPRTKSVQRGIKGLVCAFNELFENGPWKKLFDDIQTISNSQHMGTECIMKIVQRTFEICQKEAVLQLDVAKQCAAQIIETGEFNLEHRITFNNTVSSDELLRRYRYMHAELSTERLQRLILQDVKSILSNTYNIEMGENVIFKTFVRDCVAITWLLCVEDPTIVMVYDRNPEKIDVNKYHIVQGKPFIDIVWPALKIEGGDSVISKGIAWSK